jgi:lipoprotein-anchoring transpeptidase ErfK/SrfK
VRLLVLDSAVAATGATWVKVRLPTRPNDATGWIPAGRARIVATPWRLVLDLSERRRVVIGKPGTPTPTGLFAISEKIRQPRGSEIGPSALHLTAHSNVLENFGGGPGRVAIHGRAGALLRAPLGSAASHGCVRADSREVSWMAVRLREGTPVLVKA